MKAKRTLLCMILVLVCFLCGCQTSQKAVEIPPIEGDFKFTILKAGQADAMLMQTKSHNVILDCGEEDDGDELVALLQEKGISQVDYLFITHFDKDHVGGFPEVVRHINASHIMVPDYEGNNDEYQLYQKTVAENNLSITVLSEDTNIIMDDVVFEVSTPKKSGYAEGDNDFSLVISATHGENTFLFAGDAEKDRLAEVITEFGKQHDFLKVPHHGKYNKNTKRFISTIKPSYSVICDSDKHPAEKELMSILDHVGSRMFSTRDGDVFVSSNGKEIKISQ